MKLLTKEQQKSYENAKNCYICKEKLKIKNTEDKKYRKVRDHCHYTGEYRAAAYSIYNLKFSVPKETTIAFHNGSNYDYHFITKELPEEFKGQSTCLGKNTKKYIPFTVPIEKEVIIIDKKETKSQKLYLTHYNLLIGQDL